MKIYCAKCFAKSEFKFTKPKFCPECGSKMGYSLEASNVKSESASIGKNNSDKIKAMEIELQKLKSADKVVSKNQLDDQDSEFDDQYDEDFITMQKHIDNFKNKRNKFGVIVEKDIKSDGISFGSLMESASRDGAHITNEFKMIEDSNILKQSKQEILNQLKIEASSQARVIEID